VRRLPYAKKEVKKNANAAFLLNLAMFSVTITLMYKTKYPLLLIVAFFVLTLFIFIPGTIYLTNSMEFTNGYLALLLAGISLALVCGLLFLLIARFLRSKAPRFLEKWLALVFGFAFLIWFQGNFLLWNYGPLDGRTIPWSSLAWRGFIDGGIWIGLLAAAFIFSPFVLRIAKRVCVFLIFMQLVYGTFLLFKQPQTPSFQQYTVDTSKRFVFSKNKNVIIIILDSYPTDVFQEIINQHRELAKDLDGFTYFRNSLGGYPFTELSVALILTGKYYDNSLPFEEWKRDAYTSASIPRVLTSAGWQVDVYPKVSFSVYYSDQIASNFVKGVPTVEKVSNIAQIYDMTLFRSLPHFFKPWIYNDQSWLLKRIGLKFMGKRFQKRDIHRTRVTGYGSEKKLRLQHIFLKKALRYSSDLQFIAQMLTESSTADTKGTFKFYHLGMPHLPLLLDENFRYQVMAATRQNYTKNATSAVKLMIIFLKRLKEMGIYDDSLVFIVGDHGAGGQQQKFIVQPGMPSAPGQSVVTDFARVTAMPLILFKPPASHGELKITDAPASLGDIPATVFSNLGMPVAAPGTPLQALDPSAPRERRFMVYSGRNIFSYYANMTEYFVSGYGWLNGSWRPSGRIFTRNGMQGPKR